MRWLCLIAALAFAGCASAPPVACQPPATPQASALADEGYVLAGRVVSLLADGKMSSTVAIKLNAELQSAQADIRAGQTAQAQVLIEAVKQNVQ